MIETIKKYALEFDAWLQAQSYWVVFGVGFGAGAFFF